MSPAAREWWRRAAAAIKDRRSLCLARLAAAVRCGCGSPLHPDLESAVIRATTHSDRPADPRPTARVLAWARASPALLEPLMCALARRARRTRSWPVALKSLLLAHGLLLLGGRPIGRLPFDLSCFSDPRAPPARSALVRAYFIFLDRRSVLSDDRPGTDVLDGVERTQELLDLVMHVRPFGSSGGAEESPPPPRLVMDVMDCVVLDCFDVYSRICSGIAAFLVGVLRSTGGCCRRGAVGIRALRKAREQSLQLAEYFEACRRFGVLNATEFPAVQSVSEEDISDLEKLVLGGSELAEEGKRESVVTADACREPVAAMSEEWVVFEDVATAAVAVEEFSGNPFVAVRRPAAQAWEMNVTGNLIELM